MRRTPVVIVAAAVVAAGVLFGIRTADAASGSLTVTTIGRDGVKVPTLMHVIKADGSTYWNVSSNKPRALANGKYYVLADIYNQADGTDTLAGRVVTVSGSKAFTIDARQGRLLRTHLDVPAGYSQRYDNLRLCAGDLSTGSIDAYNDAGKVYLLGDTSKLLHFAYVTTFRNDNDAAADQYVISPPATAGLPVRPIWEYQSSGLGTVRMNAMRGPAGAPDTMLALQPQAGSCQRDLFTNLGQDVTPMFRRVHVSPGSWDARADTFADNGDDIGGASLPVTVKAGQSYLKTYYRSVWGPGDNAPYTASADVRFDTSGMFTDPSPGAFEGSEKSTVSLTLNKKVVATQTRADWGDASPEFQYRIKAAGWYTMAVDAHRYRPGINYPADMLSTRSAAVFRFYADPKKSANPPLALPRFLPAGVTNSNSVAPGTSTPVTITLQRPTVNNDMTWPAVKVKTIAAWASYDDGKVWHATVLRRSGTTWIATVNNPASGYVSLRATVTDPSGASSQTTVIRAYAVK